MANIEYKVLFEVRVLHDHYLYGVEPGVGGNVQKAQKSFFAMSLYNQSTRLAELINNGRYDVRRELGFTLGKDEESLLRNLRMKWVRTATGFFLGIQVRRINAANGEVRFKPVIAPAENTYVNVGFSAVNPLFGAFSNLRLDRDSNNIYCFTNDGPHSGFSLASPVKPMLPGQQYRMGDLAIVAGRLQQALADNSGNPRFWGAVAGQGLIHQDDRYLNPQEDWYTEWRRAVKLRSAHPLGMIRIALNSENEKLSPINSEGLLTKKKGTTIQNRVHPTFELRWLSRATYWRYRKKDGFSKEERVHIINSTGEFLTEEEHDFVTRKPLPIIRERAMRQFSAVPFGFPSAQPGFIKQESGKIFSVIEFNGLNPIPE